MSPATHLKYICKFKASRSWVICAVADEPNVTVYPVLQKL